MRIAYLLTSLGIGGAERQVVDLAERMAQRGHTVLLLVLREKEAQEWPTRLEVLHLDMRRTPEDLGDGLVSAWRQLRKFHPDLVHSHTFPANLTARLLRLLGAAPAVVTTIHNNREGVGRRRWIYRATDGLCAHTTTVSADAAERFIASKAAPRKKCSVLANAIDHAAFVSDAQRRVSKRQELGAGDDFVWMAAGRVVPEKDYPNLMRAFAKVRTACSGVQLWIAGAGVLDPGAGIPEAIMERTSGAENMLWLGLRRDMPGLLDAADGFVLSSASEGMPLVIGEAMAMEKVVVATDVGGVRELMGETGSVVPAHDSDALAAAMLEVMCTTRDERTRMGRAERMRIVDRFSMEKKAEEWEQLYCSVAARRPSQSHLIFTW